MSQRVLGVVVATIASLSWADGAWADVIPLGESKLVRADLVLQSNGGVPLHLVDHGTSDASGNMWAILDGHSEALASALQYAPGINSITANRMQVRADVDLAGANSVSNRSRSLAAAIYRSDFRLDGDYQFLFDATVNDVLSINGSLIFDIHLTNLHTSEEIYSFSIHTDQNSLSSYSFLTLSDSEVLQSGDYRLMISAFAETFPWWPNFCYAFTRLDLDWNLHLQPIAAPVPEPGLALLLSLGVAGITVARRRLRMLRCTSGRGG
jgi:hypothetical protein